MNLVKKALLFCKKEGVINTLTRSTQKCWELASHVPCSVWERMNEKKYADTLKDHITGKQVYVLIPCIDWNIPIFQRPHQIATSLTRLPNAHVLFVSDEYKYDNFAGTFPVNEHLDVVSHRIVPQLKEIFSAAEQVTVFMSWPRQAHLLEFIPYDKFVYEYIDDLSLFYYYTQQMTDTHYRLIREADLTVCTARVLYEDALPTARKALLSPNAGDYDFFHSSRGCAIEPTLTDKVKGYDCVLGYYGCLASWFDYDLVIEVAKKMPNWCFVFVGYCFDGTIERLKKEALDNIILYPAQPYRKLPAFVAGFDIQTIPFVIDTVTKATSPVKLFEYMASGKPILTSALPECLQYQSVAVYHSADDFIAKAQRLLQLDRDDAYFEIMEQEARANTWDSRVSEIINHLNGAI